MGRRERGDLRGALRAAAREGRRAPERGRRLRHRRVRRRRPCSSDRGARHHGEPVARPLREDALHRPDRRRARRDGAAGARPPRAFRLGGSRGGRHADGDVRLPPPVPHGGRDRRDVLRGRDQEVDLHRHERPPAARGRLPDALLGEPRRGGARGCVLRSLRHRQDDALRRSRAPPHRRRRARLVRRRRLQLRGRLLREGDPPLGRGRAADLRDDARLRHGARERRHGRARRPRSGRRLEDGEHARRLQARADRERAPGEARRPSRAPSSSSPPTPSGSSRRSRG